MKRFTEQLESKARTVRLSASERAELRERVVSYVEYHPLPLRLKEEGILTEGSVVTPVRLVHLNLWRLLQWSVAPLAVLVFSVSYLAERAVPGDALYAIKVSVNEEVRGTLARTSYDKVVWETERLNRRIAEARLLASEGRLTETVEAEVAEAVKVHSDNARREIEVLKQTDLEEAALASIALETTIDVQTTALKNEANIVTNEDHKESLIASALEDTQNIEITTTVVDTLPSYERLMAHVEQETTRSRELLQSVRKNATPDEQVDIERRLADIDRSISEAIEFLSTDEVMAREVLVDVLERNQRLVVFMTNIDIRSTVTVEEIVPVTLTTEERNSKLATDIEETLQLVVRIEEALTVMTLPVELSEKINPALLESKAIASSTQARLPVVEAELETVETEVRNALALAQDIVVAIGLDLGTEVATDPNEVLPVVDAVIDTEATSTATTTETTDVSIDTQVDSIESGVELTSNVQGV